MDARMLASDPVRSLAWLAGQTSGWVELDRIGHRLKCMLCFGPVDPRKTLDHGLAHLAAAQVEYDALATLISLIADERRLEERRLPVGSGAYRAVFEEAVDQVFGFRPGTSEAVKFWQEHGEHE